AYVNSDRTVRSTPHALVTKPFGQDCAFEEDRESAMNSDLLELGSADSAGTTDSAKRRQIVEGARRVFLAQGFDAASMGEIARSAGVSKGTLYVYFTSKEE